MKASANGVPNLSILDGWWIEGWASDNSNGWGIEPSVHDGPSQDAEEANRIYETIERQVVPTFYDVGPDEIPHEWIRIQKEAMRTVAPKFSAQRMVIEYITRLYAPAAEALAPV
jgi:starch phosphorylase